ncbi:hypothetical protein AX17_002076 [Amanita inopinata Kibby_2008]|nr:hypothetical protein AX17_002076 [Amanita inopinata Kibby_2008]
MDVNIPRDKETGKTKGFGFLMYEDQRSTVLAVDNLNGAKVLDRTLRVDHVKNYKQPKVKGEDGDWVESEEQSLNARPQLIDGQEEVSDSSDSDAMSIDLEDPMRDYLIAKRKEEKALKKKKMAKSKGKHKDKTPEERASRKARKKAKREKKKLKSEGMKGVEELLNNLTRRDPGASRDRSPQEEEGRRRSRSRDRSAEDHDRRRARSRTPVYHERRRFSSHSMNQRRFRSPSRTPPRSKDD